MLICSTLLELVILSSYKCNILFCFFHSSYGVFAVLSWHALWSYILRNKVGELDHHSAEDATDMVCVAMMHSSMCHIL